MQAGSAFEFGKKKNLVGKTKPSKGLGNSAPEPR